MNLVGIQGKFSSQDSSVPTDISSPIKFVRGHIKREEEFKDVRSLPIVDDDDDNFVLKGSVGRASLKKAERAHLTPLLLYSNEAIFDEDEPEVSSGDEDDEGGL